LQHNLDAIVEIEDGWIIFCYLKKYGDGGKTMQYIFCKAEKNMKKVFIDIFLKKFIHN
jgi:hypothetical protein